MLNQTSSDYGSLGRGTKRRKLKNGYASKPEVPSTDWDSSCSHMWIYTEYVSKTEEICLGNHCRAHKPNDT